MGIYNIGSKGCISKLNLVYTFAHKMKFNQNLIKVKKLKKEYY